MAATYTPIASITLGAAAASVTFSSIPQTYTDLVLVGSVNTTAGLDYWYRLNSDSGSNYSNTQVRGNGTSAISFRVANATLNYFNGGAAPTTQHSFTMNLMNYSNTTTNKTQLIRYDNAAQETILRVGLYRSTAAISTVLIQTDSSTFTAGSTFNLYGILGANA
jgi:hypothetical protein